MRVRYAKNLRESVNLATAVETVVSMLLLTRIIWLNATDIDLEVYDDDYGAREEDLLMLDCFLTTFPIGHGLRSP